MCFIRWGGGLAMILDIWVKMALRYTKNKIFKKIAQNIFINLSKTQNPARSSFLALSERFETSKHANSTFVSEIWNRSTDFRCQLISSKFHLQKSDSHV